MFYIDILWDQVSEQKLHHIVSFPINFTAMSVPTVPYTHPDFAPLRYGDLPILMFFAFEKSWRWGEGGGRNSLVC